MPRTKSRKTKGSGLIGDNHESVLPFEYKCLICGKNVIHTNRGNHIQDSKHGEVIYPTVFKAIK